MSYIPPVSITEQLFLNIKHMILAREIACGERISEEKLSAAFGVSRTPVRDALRRLENYGLVRIKPRSYAEVVTLDDDEIYQIAEARAAVECGVVKLLIEKADAEAIERIKRVVDGCWAAVQNKELAGVFEQDSLLHQIMARETGNNYLIDIMDKMDAKMQLYRILRCTSIGHVQKSVKQHFDILDAILRRDEAKACEHMRSHAYAMIGTKETKEKL